MNESTRPTTARERDRALRRLRSITNGTAVIATLATAGFGALAAVTWSGTSTDTAAEQDDTTTVTTGTTLTSGLLVGDEDGDLLPSAEAPPTAAPLQPTPTPLATAKHKSRVTSGGSG